jgi:hypothetical protein
MSTTVKFVGLQLTDLVLLDLILLPSVLVLVVEEDCLEDVILEWFVLGQLVLERMAVEAHFLIVVSRTVPRGVLELTHELPCVRRDLLDHVHRLELFSPSLRPRRIVPSADFVHSLGLVKLDSVVLLDVVNVLGDGQHDAASQQIK